jgi:membrane-associated protease RseP (regulator of RpoE activity)
LLIFAVVFGLSSIVMVHESAHFLAAKLSGMLVTEYFVGFGPRIWSFTKGETEYGIKSIWAGGYVRIIGMSNLEEVDPADESRTYRAKPFYQRAITTAAGVISHFILAFLLLIVGLVFVGEPQKNPPPVIGSLARYSGFTTGAEKAGLRPNDRIISVDGTTFEKWDSFRSYIRAHVDQKLQLVFERAGARQSAEVTPIDNAKLNNIKNPKPADHFGLLGLEPRIAYVPQGFGRSVVLAARGVGSGTVHTVAAFGHAFSPSGLSELWTQLTGQKAADGTVGFSSPVGIVRLADQAAKSGWWSRIGLLVAFNLSLGVLNILPILPFDGGHLAIATYEAIRSRKGKRYQVDVTKIAPVAYVVVGIFALMFIASLILNITNPAPNPFQ